MIKAECVPYGILQQVSDTLCYVDPHFHNFPCSLSSMTVNKIGKNRVKTSQKHNQWHFKLWTYLKSTLNFQSDTYIIKTSNLPYLYIKLKL